jgi:hypothetical protein
MAPAEARVSHSGMKANAPPGPSSRSAVLSTMEPAELTPTLPSVGPGPLEPLHQCDKDLPWLKRRVTGWSSG